MWKGIYFTFISILVSCGAQPQLHCGNSDCGWRRWSPDVEGRYMLKHSQTTNNGWYSGFRVGQEAKHCSQSKASVYGKFTKGLRLLRIFVRCVIYMNIGDT